MPEDNLQSIQAHKRVNLFERLVLFLRRQVFGPEKMITITNKPGNREYKLNVANLDLSFHISTSAYTPIF
jgi:hypothetical protein